MILRVVVASKHGFGAEATTSAGLRSKGVSTNISPCLVGSTTPDSRLTFSIPMLLLKSSKLLKTVKVALMKATLPWLAMRL
jgi:hypothetical protein